MFEEECSLETHLLDSTAHAKEADSRGIVGFLDGLHAVTELDAFSAVGLFDGGRESWRGSGGVGWSRISLGHSFCRHRDVVELCGVWPR